MPKEFPMQTIRLDWADVLAGNSFAMTCGVIDSNAGKDIAATADFKNNLRADNLRADNLRADNLDGSCP